jgi:hypothetical protein
VDLTVLSGAVNTVLIRDGAQGMLIDCCDTVTPERLRACGVTRVEAILLTQPRRTHLAGAYVWEQLGTPIFAWQAAAGPCP